MSGGVQLRMDKIINLALILQKVGPQWDLKDVYFLHKEASL